MTMVLIDKANSHKTHTVISIYTLSVCSKAPALSSISWCDSVMTAQSNPSINQGSKEM